MGPARQDDPAQDRDDHLGLGHLAQEQVDRGRPVPDGALGAGINGRVRVDQAGAEQEQATAGLQMADALAGGGHALTRIGGSIDHVLAGVRQVLEERGVAGNDLDVPPTQLGGGDDDVVSPGVVRDDQQGAVRRDGPGAAPGHFPDPVSRHPAGGGREAVRGDHPVGGDADRRKAVRDLVKEKIEYPARPGGLL